MFEKLGAGEIILILVVVLLIFGPSKLPALGKSIGEGMREFKKSISGVSGEQAEQKEPEKKA